MKYLQNESKGLTASGVLVLYAVQGFFQCLYISNATNTVLEDVLESAHWTDQK